MDGNRISVAVNRWDVRPLLPVHANTSVPRLLAENAMLKPTLFLAALFAVSGLAEAGTPRSVHLDRKGDRIDQRLDLKGDRINDRLDVKSDRAAANGHEKRARHLDIQGNRIERRLDLKGDRINRHLDQRAKRVLRRP
jgi:hypothetical protein